MGSSAGGHLAACLSTLEENWANIGDYIDEYSYKPEFTLLISPVISMGEIAHKGSRENLLGKQISSELANKFSCNKQVPPLTPPAFLVHALNDNSVSPLNSILYYSALIENKVSGPSLHIFSEGGHSIALRNNAGTANSWALLAEKWLWEIGIIK